MNLFPFQEQALQEIPDKFLHHLDILSPGEGRNYPFIQFLRAITGAGKTPILAAVVGQTLANLDEGGKYHSVFVVSEVLPASLSSTKPKKASPEEDEIGRVSSVVAVRFVEHSLA